MSREVCGICWCPYDEDTGECACAPEPKEPVAWMMVNPTHPRLHKSLHWKPQTDWHITWEAVPLYTAPPQRKPLTEEEIDQAANNIFTDDPVQWWRKLARAIERAHGIGGAPEERNFCPRCGKRTNDIHTCTPP